MKGKEYKKITAKVLLAAMFLLGAFTQKTYAQEAVGYIGLTAAPLYTGMSSDRSSIGSVFGYSAGLTPEIKFGEGFGIELDLLISQKGGVKKYLDSFNIYNGTYYFNYNQTYNFMYAEGDLLFKWYIHLDHNPIVPYDAPGHHTFLYFMAGPIYASRVSYNITGSSYQYESPPFGSKDTFLGSYQKMSAESDSAIKGKTISTDIGVTVGIGLVFPVSHRGLLSFEARYSKGITSIDNGEFGHYLLQYAVPPTTPETKVVWCYPAALSTFDLGLYISYKYRIFGGGE